jgi:hypothetical protein
MTAIQLDTHPGGRRRAIGPLGTTARVLVGGLLLASVTWGHLTRGFHPSAWLLGLVGFPALLVAGQWLRTRRTPTPLQATGPVAHALNVAVFVMLYLLEPTSDAALLFYGASMWLAARLCRLRGAGRVQLAAAPRRPDRLRGVLAHRPAGAAPNRPPGLAGRWRPAAGAE